MRMSINKSFEMLCESRNEKAVIVCALTQLAMIYRDEVYINGSRAFIATNNYERKPDLYTMFDYENHRALAGQFRIAVTTLCDLAEKLVEEIEDKELRISVQEYMDRKQ